MDSSGSSSHDLYLSHRESDQWQQIQQNTFTNWVNEGLRGRVIVIDDLQTDLSDGVNLVALVESLSRRSIAGAVSQPSNQYQKLQNITLALETIQQDGVKIVNIDSSDIVDNNLKLIMGLVWQLILKYQVGFSGSKSKSWILTWLQGVIPECHVTNLTTDWNDGVALHALLDFCKPGLSPAWHTLDKEDKVENCRSAMKLARQHFNVPLILRPEDLASPGLDEKSAITYMSYFIKVGGPGYVASLEQVANRTKPVPLTNFTTDWHDGQALINLVRSAGGHIGDVEDGGSARDKLTQGMEAGSQLGVEPLLKPEEVESHTVEHLGLMAYSVQFLRFPNFIFYSDLGPDATTNHNGTTTTTTTGDDMDDILDMYPTTATSATVQTITLTKVTEYKEDAAAHTAIIHAPLAQPTHEAKFDLVTRTHGHAPGIEAPPPDMLKVDTYSTGVIMESTIYGPFDPDKFKIEASSPNGRVIKISGDGYYSAQFGPSEIGRWTVSMSYEDKQMDKSPVDVCDPSQVIVKGLRGGLAGRTNEFVVDCTKAGPGDLGVDVSNRGLFIQSSVLTTGTSGLYKVRFVPYNPGPHEVNVHFNRAEVRDADFYTFDQEERQRKALFKTEITPHQGHVEIKASCDWEIDYLTGGAFVCNISDALNIPVYKMQDGTVCGRPELIVDCTSVGECRLNAEATKDGLRIPCKIREEADRPDTYRIRFKPRGPGSYKVYVNLDGVPIRGSPFTQNIAELEAASAHGDGLYRGVLGSPATFTISPRGIPGEISVLVKGPTRSIPSQLEVQEDQTILATYLPVERGLHKVDIHLDGKHIRGSPFNVLIADPVKVRVSGGWRPLLDEKGVIPLKVYKEKVLPFDVSEAGPGELTAEVQGPNGKIPVAIDARQDGKHSVVFTPREIGPHYIHVYWGSYPLASSPYLGEATMDPGTDQIDGDPYPNVRLVQIPLQPQPMRPTSPAPSSTTTIDRPTTVAYRILDQPDAPEPYPYHVTSYPQPYPYTVYNRSPPPPVEPTRIQMVPSRRPVAQPQVMYQQPIRMYQYEPQTPQRQPSFTSATSGSTLVRPSNVGSLKGPQKVVLSGKGLKEAVIRTPAHFQVNGTKADPGVPSSYLQSVNHRIPVSHQPVRPNVYQCNYTPTHPGAYLLYINWNDKPLRGSPFKVNIREPVDASKVHVLMNPQTGVVGRDFDMKADPRNAGLGVLSAACDDPVGRDVPVRVNENADGTINLRFRPTRPGRHRVDVKYNGDHVKGSPFAVVIQEPRPHGTVKVWGPGIENGAMDRFESTFWVETTGAGAGDLRVRIIGPRGAFKVKMRKASEKDKIYQYFYDPEEPGVYTVHVQWSGQHVTGSPFTVLLGEDEIDLARMRQELHNISPNVDLDRAHDARRDIDGLHNYGNSLYSNSLNYNNRDNSVHSALNDSRTGSLYRNEAADGDRRTSRKSKSKKNKRNSINNSTGDLLY